MSGQFHDTTGYYGHKPQMRMFTMANEMKHRCFFKLIHLVHGHVFCSTGKILTLANMIDRLDTKDRTIHELFRAGVNFFADIDGYKRPPNFIASFEKQFAETLMSEFQETFDKTRVRWTDASRKAKFSLHFTYAGDKYWEDAPSQRKFWKKLDNELVDMCCYSKNRCLRAVSCFHPAKPYPLKKIGDHPTIEYLVQVPDDDPREVYFVPSVTSEHVKFRGLIKLLSQERRDNRELCLKTIWALAGCSKDFNCDMLKVAIEFASDSPKFDRSWVIKMFATSTGRLGLGSLLYWAKQDALLKDSLPVIRSFRKDPIQLSDEIEKILNTLFNRDVKWDGFGKGATVELTPRDSSWNNFKLI